MTTLLLSQAEVFKFRKWQDVTLFFFFFLLVQVESGSWNLSVDV